MSSDWGSLITDYSLLINQKILKMKFIHYIEKIGGVDIYGLISLSIFFLFFSVMLTWVFRSDKKKMKELSKIPLE
jgi:hypothetical protein